MLSQAKKSIFSFLICTDNGYSPKKKFHVPEVLSDRFNYDFKIFPILVELTKLGGQNFKLELYSKKFIKCRSQHA